MIKWFAVLSAAVMFTPALTNANDVICEQSLRKDVAITLLALPLGVFAQESRSCDSCQREAHAFGTLAKEMCESGESPCTNPEDAYNCAFNWYVANNCAPCGGASIDILPCSWCCVP